ncbi:MAG: phenylalanine--tRNA ligase subunit alpha [Caldilineae bacterium]|nr:phenylalanine--tRNA ligase subunit alpha [Chloroflexota bacterium]MCB9175574.1 phenylalanine--tRNA ligase subunit alpha [Caldilineae bacterium]
MAETSNGSNLAEITAAAMAALEAADGEAALQAFERTWLGKQGPLAELLASIPRLPAADRPRVGKAANQLKRELAEGLDARRSAIAEAALRQARSADDYDASLPAPRSPRGSLHPITRIRREVEDIFGSMGYRVLDGPEVELDHYNFEALNFPANHPARDLQDTFWCDNEGHVLLRTHTSPVQIRAMQRLKPPFRAIVPGRVFRNEAVDAKHEHTFHQVEGLVIDEGIHVGHLIGTLKGVLREIFASEIDIRLRPGYFPFVEPGFEVDIRLPDAGSRGGVLADWVEFCGAGMVHPNVLRAGGVDPERYSGFAFGMGLDRMVMLRYGIDDIRHFMAGDLRFLTQF